MGFYTKNGGLIGTGSITTKIGVYNIIASQVIGDELYAFTSFTFTNAQVTGRLGATKTQLLNSYNTVGNPWLLDTNLYDVVGFPGYQLWTVPATGVYRFDLFGASRGSANTKGASARITADVNLIAGQKLWIICGQQGLNNAEVGDGGTWVVLSNNGTLAGSTPLLVAGGAGDYSFYSSEANYQTGQGFSNAQTTDSLDASVLNVAGVSSPTTGNGGTVFVPAGQTPGFVSGGGGFNTNGNIISGGSTQGMGLSFFNGLYGGMYQFSTFDTTTTAGGGFGGGGARNGGFGTGGGGGYTGGAAAGSTSPALRRSTGGSSFVINTATNITRQLASAGAPNATVQQGRVEVTLL